MRMAQTAQHFWLEEAIKMCIFGELLCLKLESSEKDIPTKKFMVCAVLKDGSVFVGLISQQCTLMDFDTGNGL
jgi:hypothetical protein